MELKGSFDVGLKFTGTEISFLWIVDRREWAVVIVDLVGGAKQVLHVYTKDVTLAGQGAVRSKGGAGEGLARQGHGRCQKYRENGEAERQRYWRRRLVRQERP